MPVGRNRHQEECLNGRRSCSRRVFIRAEFFVVQGMAAESRDAVRLGAGRVAEDLVLSVGWRRSGPIGMDDAPAGAVT